MRSIAFFPNPFCLEEEEEHEILSGGIFYKFSGSSQDGLEVCTQATTQTKNGILVVRDVMHANAKILQCKCHRIPTWCKKSHKLCAKSLARAMNNSQFYSAKHWHLNSRLESWNVPPRCPRKSRKIRNSFCTQIQTFLSSRKKNGDEGRWGPPPSWST